MAGSEQPVAEAVAPLPTWDLESEHSGPLLRLERVMRGRQSFTLVVLEYSDSSYRDRVAGYLDLMLNGGGRIDAREVEGNFSALEERLVVASQVHRRVQVVGLEDWPRGLSSLWRAFNYHRERIADSCPVPLMLWVLRGNVGSLALEAPDFWAWRSGVFDFGNSPAPTARGLSEGRLDRGRAPGVDREQRIGEIDAYLDRLGPPNHPVDLGLLVERGELLEDVGDLKGALESFRAAAVGYEKSDDRRGEALAKRRIAKVIATRGDPAGALRILREESLPVYDQLGDVRSRAITMGQIADILFRRGDLDEALRIRQEEELPVYDQLGDVRSRAITMGKIADILESRGDLDEALRIRQEEELPVYDQLGDVRERAITMGKIADILFRRGDLDEALRIRQAESLPVYDQLGDVRLRAITMGKIADILESRGDLDEALRIRQEESLPVYDQLGDVHSRAIASAKTGLLLTRLGRRGEARELLVTAMQDAERLRIPEAATIRGFLAELETEDG